MKKKRTALIGSNLKITWSSCIEISKNLLNSYSHLHREREIEHFFLSKNNIGLTKKLQQFNPHEIIFFDFSPYYLNFLKLLSSQLGSKLPTVIIHIYGDFTWNVAHWLKSEDSIKGWKIRFLCSSPRFAEFFKQFINPPAEVIMCPFPVDSDFFFFSDHKREVARKNWTTADKEKIWLYTGRISLQKNVDRLILEFAKSFEKNPHQRLILAGEYDDRAFSFTHMQAPVGYQFQMIRKVLSSLPQSIQKKIIHFNQNSTDDLLHFYCGADIFCSLSLHHDEDFGMAPAEALSTGLPALLTDWGGYQGFQKRGIPSNLVPVTFQQPHYSISSDSIQTQIKSISHKCLPNVRHRQGQVFAQHFGTHAISSHLLNILEKKAPPKFCGLSPAARMYQQEFQKNSGYPFEATFYERLYEPMYAN